MPCTDVSRVRLCVLGYTRSSVARREYWAKGLKTEKKLNVYANYKLQEKQHHTICKFVCWVSYVVLRWDNRQHCWSANDFSSSWVFCTLSNQISSIALFIVSKMTENPMVKYVKFWFCNGRPKFSISCPRNPKIWKPGYISIWPYLKGTWNFISQISKHDWTKSLVSHFFILLSNLKCLLFLFYKSE